MREPGERGEDGGGGGTRHWPRYGGESGFTGVGGWLGGEAKQVVSHRSVA